MRLSQEEVEHIATLARLGLTPEEREQFRDQLTTILNYVHILSELDTSRVPPSAQVIRSENVVRADVIQPSLDVEDVLANAPAREDNYFRVPPIFEET